MKNNAPDVPVEMLKFVEAGKNEPYRSAIRSSWKSIGFFIHSKARKGVTIVTTKTWRH